MKLLRWRDGRVGNGNPIQAVELLMVTVNRDEDISWGDSGVEPEGSDVLEENLPQTRGIPMEHNSSWERMRRKKILTIRRQFQLGQYEVETRLAAILDQLLDDLII